MSTMASLLEQWTSDTIKKYVYLLGGASSITRKAERIAFIRQQMLDEQTLRTIWAQLDPIAKRAVSAAYHSGGLFDATAFVAQYGSLPPRPQKERWFSYYQQEPILFDLFVIDGRVPSDLMPLLADLVLPAERFQLEGSDEPPRALDAWDQELPILVAETEIVGRADLLTYLQLVDQDELRWTKSKNVLTAGSVRKVMANLLDGGFQEEPERVTRRSTIRPFGLDVFSQESKLVTRTGKLTGAGRRYLQTQDPAIMLEAFERWADQGEFDELTRIAELRGLNAAGTRLTPPAERRAQVIEALSWCPVNRWIDIGDFYRAMLIWNFNFEVETTQWSNLYAGPYREYGFMNGSDYWTIVKGLYINAILWEYLGTIGAVDLAYVDADFTILSTDIHYTDEPFSLHEGLLAFRINPWGAFLLGQADEYVPSQPRQKALFTIDDDLRVHPSSDLLPNERLLLEMVAQPTDDGRYRLDTVTLLTAIESGQTFDYLATFLRENHAGDLPEAATDWLKRLRGNQGLFQERGTATLVRVKRRALVDLVQRDETLSTLCQVVDDTTLLVPSTRLTRFRNRLKELGYLLG